jgi:hypothetical protein
MAVVVGGKSRTSSARAQLSRAGVYERSREVLSGEV